MKIHFMNTELDLNIEKSLNVSESIPLLPSQQIKIIQPI